MTGIITCLLVHLDSVVKNDTRTVDFAYASDYPERRPPDYGSWRPAPKTAFPDPESCFSKQDLTARLGNNPAASRGLNLQLCRHTAVGRSQTLAI